MIELKVQCDCGQKFKFDVEPVNGQMPFKVNCPLCGADGTARANEMLRLSNPAPAAPPPPPAPVGAPSVPTGAPKLRIGGSAHTPAAGADAPAPAPAAPRSFPGRPGAAPAAAGDGKPKRKPNFALGFVGGIVGALLGAAIYYVVFKFTGFHIGIMAIVVGFLAGLGARVLGGEQEGNELGYITGALVIAGIIGAQYLVAHAWWTEEEGHASKSGYEEKVAEAKKVLVAVPTGSDEEIRLYLAKEEAEGEKPDLAAVPAEAIKEFREKELPEFRNFAEGKILKQDYVKQHAAEIAQAEEDKKSDEGTFKAVFLLLLLNRVNLVSMCAAVGLAFKMSS